MDPTIPLNEKKKTMRDLIMKYIDLMLDFAPEKEI